MRAAFNLAESAECTCQGNVAIAVTRYFAKTSIHRLHRGHAGYADRDLRRETGRDRARAPAAPRSSRACVFALRWIGKLGDSAFNCRPTKGTVTVMPCSEDPFVMSHQAIEQSKFAWVQSRGAIFTPCMIDDQLSARR